MTWTKPLSLNVCHLTVRVSLRYQKQMLHCSIILVDTHQSLFSLTGGKERAGSSHGEPQFLLMQSEDSVQHLVTCRSIQGHTNPKPWACSIVRFVKVFYDHRLSSALDRATQRHGLKWPANSAWTCDEWTAFSLSCISASVLVILTS